MPREFSQEPIAIIGMSCIFPGSPSIEEFWQNIASGRSCLREPNASEWDAKFYEQKNKELFGRIYCARGGFISEYADFEPLEFGIMPASIAGSDPDQFLALRVAAEALSDAGYSHKTFQGEKAEIIIGRTMAPGVGSLNLIQHGQTVDQVIDVLRTVLPELKDSQIEALTAGLHESLNPCTADTIPAVMPNVLSGRIASKLGFKGRNLILDAACASSLITVETAIQGLRSGQSDLAIAGAIHVNSSPYFYQMFCRLGALSTSGEIKPFDDSADGTILGEGVGMIVLKRLSDAERDKNKIYALIRAVASSSDGRGGSSLAPSVEGEALAMQRAYDLAGVDPQTIELLEAHGTATPAGDKAEMQAIEKVFGKVSPDSENNTRRKPWCAIGSVKSSIGHTQAASGMAGLIKAALALHQRLIPPGPKLNKPSSQVNWQSSPCYISRQAKPWLQADETSHPRRAAVSAFGFGGVNAHAILEEYNPDGKEAEASTKLSAPAKPKTNAMRLSLSYPAIKASALKELSMDLQIQRKASPAPVQRKTRFASQSPEPASSKTPEDEKVVILRSYLDSVNSFQRNLLSVQEKVILDYLRSEPAADELD